MAVSPPRALPEGQSTVTTLSQGHGPLAAGKAGDHAPRAPEGQPCPPGLGGSAIPTPRAGPEAPGGPPVQEGATCPRRVVSGLGASRPGEGLHSAKAGREEAGQRCGAGPPRGSPRPTEPRQGRRRAPGLRHPRSSFLATFWGLSLRICGERRLGWGRARTPPRLSQVTAGSTAPALPAHGLNPQQGPSWPQLTGGGRGPGQRCHLAGAAAARSQAGPPEAAAGLLP